MYKSTIKTFNELTTSELYQILRLRSEVFVVEQDCVYQDIDDKDQQANHLFITIKNKVAAYTRLFAPGLYFDTASIGRVVVSLEYRKDGLGHQVMDASIKAVQQKFNTSKISISAQTYLKKFYESHGFIQKGNKYLEDGIPHIKMVYNK